MRTFLHAPKLRMCTISHLDANIPFTRNIMWWPKVPYIALKPYKRLLWPNILDFGIKPWLGD